MIFINVGSISLPKNEIETYAIYDNKKFIIYDINNTPTALDVYRGNTELRITYEGKIPVDTIVIYKKEK